MTRRPATGVDVALQRLILQQRVAAQQLGLEQAVSQLKSRARRAGRVVGVVRRRPEMALAACFALGLAVGLVSGRRRG